MQSFVLEAHQRLALNIFEQLPDRFQKLVEEFVLQIDLQVFQSDKKSISLIRWVESDWHHQLGMRAVLMNGGSIAATRQQFTLQMGQVENPKVILGPGHFLDSTAWQQ